MSTLLVMLHLPMGLLFYTDPGSGMLIWQLATAAALGLLFYAKTIVRKLRVLFHPHKSKEDDSRTPKA